MKQRPTNIHCMSQDQSHFLKRNQSYSLKSTMKNEDNQFGMGNVQRDCEETQSVWQLTVSPSPGYGSFNPTHYSVPPALEMAANLLTKFVKHLMK